MANFQIQINGVDKSALIDWASVSKEEVLTAQPDTLEFMIRNVPTKTYRPALNDDVKFYDGATLLFGGVVIETSEEVDGLVRYYSVVCKDYTELLDAQLVSKTYANMTAAAIVADLISNFTTGFTTVNVVAPFLVTSITFNYMTVSQCLQKLCDAISGYDWYPDYAKDIHFFLTAGISAPFVIDDTSGNYIFESLKYDTASSQIRNQIIVRGGDVAGTAVDNLQVADGKQRIFFVGYALTSFLAFKALAATPTTFVALSIGKDGIDDPTTKDALYNFDQGLLIFPDITKPAINDVIKYSGTPYYPLISIYQDNTSVAAYGAHQYLVLDKTITTKQQATDRANSQLIKYSKPTTTGSFSTYKSGLQQGQTVTINSAIRGISGSFKIQKITTHLRTPSPNTSDYVFDVDFVSTQDLGIIDVLNKLLVQNPSDQIVIGTNEVVDRIFANVETMTISEAFTSGKNLGTTFVLGAYTTNWAGGDTKRIFVLDGSRLG